MNENYRPGMLLAWALLFAPAIAVASAMFVLSVVTIVTMPLRIEGVEVHGYRCIIWPGLPVFGAAVWGWAFVKGSAPYAWRPEEDKEVQDAPE